MAQLKCVFSIRGSSSEVDKDNVHESVTPEFAMEMKCKGSEGKLQECDNSIKQYQKCESFVAVHCGGKYSPFCTNGFFLMIKCDKFGMVNCIYRGPGHMS